MSEWKKLTEEKVMINHPAGFMIIKPNFEYEHAPTDCPICLLVMRDHKDLMAYQRNECCRDCELQWAESHHDAWKAGWRPEEDELKTFQNMQRCNVKSS